jgi:predicted NBD/HSP70 family sugar kinase
MDIDEVLRGLGETFDEPGIDVEAARRRLHEAVRRLGDDPVEERRIDKLAKLVDRYESDYRLAHEALRKQDLDRAERYLRRAAQHGSDEAAFRLGQLLHMQSLRQSLKGRPDRARKLAAEAREWRRRAQESGIAEALEETSLGGVLLPRELAEHCRSQPARGPSAVRAREEAAAPPARHTSSAGTDYAVGIELMPYQFTAVLVNDGGEIVSEKTHGLSDMKPEAVVRVLAAAAREMVASAFGPEFPASNVVLGVQFGGPVDAARGTVLFFSKHRPGVDDGPPEFKWENFPLGPRLRQETGFRATVLNDAVAFAERERWLGVGRQTGNFVVMLIREGVGGAVVKKGEHFDGPVEIGNFRFSSDSVRQADAGVFGVLELTGGTTGVTESAGEYVPGRPIADLETAAAVASEDGPGRAADAAFLSAGVAIACGLSYLVQFAGPSHAVLYAPEAMLRPGRHSTRAFLGQVQKFREAVAFEAYRNCELVLRSTGLADGAHGAALAALNRCLQIDPAASRVSAGA